MCVINVICIVVQYVIFLVLHLFWHVHDIQIPVGKTKFSTLSLYPLGPSEKLSEGSNEGQDMIPSSVIDIGMKIEWLE